MVKKTTAKKKNTRLGHDPFDDPVFEDGGNTFPPSQKIAPDNEQIETEADIAKSNLHLPSHFSIATVEEIHAQMSSILNLEKMSVEIDPSEVESVDTAAIQMLYAFIEQIKVSGKSTHWKIHSEKIAQASSMLNINILNNDKQN